MRFEKLVRAIREPIQKRFLFKEYMSLEEASLIGEQSFNEVSLIRKLFFK